jgi:hypothetical protein
MFFLCCLSEDMAVGDAISLSVLQSWDCAYRYLDARTNRDIVHDYLQIANS